MAVLAPIERPSVASTTSVKAGLFRSWRSAKRTSFQSGIEHSRCNGSARPRGPNSKLFLNLTRRAACAGVRLRDETGRSRYTGNLPAGEFFLRIRLASGNYFANVSFL